MSQTFNIVVEGDYTLTIDEIWPDGDAPANPTAVDVANVMRRGGTMHMVLADWNLDDHRVTVYGDDQSEEVWP